MNMPTFQSQGMTPTATGEYAVYPDPSTVDLVGTSSKQGPRKIHRPANSKIYKPFYYLLLVYLFIYCSRITELIPHAHVGIIIREPVLLIGVFMTGRMKAILRMPLGKILIAFTAWIMICVPFSVWRGGSFSTFLLVLQGLALVVFMAAFIQTIPDCFRVMSTVALATAAIGLLSLRRAQQQNKQPTLRDRRKRWHPGRSQRSLPLHTHRPAFSLAIRFREDRRQEGNVAVLDGSNARRCCSNRIKNGATRSGCGLMLLSHFCVSQTEDDCHCRRGRLFNASTVFLAATDQGAVYNIFRGPLQPRRSKLRSQRNSENDC